MNRLIQAMAFAAAKHRNQRRKDAQASPYINHPIALANVLANEAGVTDEAVLISAVLHDTVEDTDTSPAELAEIFGEDVAPIVMEVTDDKSLPKAERKRLQIEHAARISDQASSSSSRTRSATCATSWPCRLRIGIQRGNGTISTGQGAWSIRCAAFIPCSKHSSTQRTPKAKYRSERRSETIT